jgi:hypothetical protein
MGGAVAHGQVGAPGRNGAQPSSGNEGLRQNSFQPTKAVAMPNKIIQPIPLSASARDMALEGIDRHVAEEVTALKEQVKHTLPDELAILAKTTGWTPENQNALLVALRSGDPAAVYEAWARGNPQDTAGAEIAARQVDVKRCVAKLEKDIQNKAAITQALSELDDAVAKVTVSTPAMNDVAGRVKALKTWGDLRKLVENAIPENGPVAKLPSGKVQLVFNPELPVGQAIVCGNSAVIIGNQGHGPLSIQQGNAAEALGLPLVTGSPLHDAESPEMLGGIMLLNPAKTHATINYNINGNHYVMEPGMAQRIPDGNWTVEYDRGQKFGVESYKLSPGTFSFALTDNGWQLFRDRFDVVVDNSDSPQEFNFIFHGENMTAPAHGTKTLNGAYPIVIAYDRGNGSDFVTKATYTSGNVQVGVNKADNMWDLFPTNENQREVTKLKLFQ